MTVTGVGCIKRQSEKSSKVTFELTAECQRRSQFQEEQGKSPGE